MSRAPETSRARVAHCLGGPRRWDFHDPRSPWNCTHFLPHLILFSPPTHTPPREFSPPCWISRRTSSGCKTGSTAPEAPEGWSAACSRSAYLLCSTDSLPCSLLSAQAGNGQAAGKQEEGEEYFAPPCQETAASSGWILSEARAPAHQSLLGESRAHWLQRPLVRPRGGNDSPLLPALQVFHHLLLAFFYHTYMLENGPSHKVSPITHGSVPAGP